MAGCYKTGDSSLLICSLNRIQTDLLLYISFVIRVQHFKSSRKIRSISPAIFWSKIMALTSKLRAKLRISMFAVP